jgi:hypothetical protein
MMAAVLKAVPSAGRLDQRCMLTGIENPHYLASGLAL